MKNTARQALGLGILANVLWGTSFLAAKTASASVGSPLVATWIALTVALLTFLAVGPLAGHRLTAPRGASQWRIVFMIGLSGFACFYPALYAGLVTLSSSLSASLLLASPLFGALLAVPVLGEKLGVKSLAGIALGALGCLAILLLGTETPTDLAANSSTTTTSLGALYTLVAAMSLALSIVFTRQAALAHPQMGATDLTFFSVVVGWLLLTPIAIIELVRSGGFETFPGFSGWVALIYSGVACTAIPCLLWNRSLSLAPVQAITPTMYLKTPVAIAVGVWLANDPAPALLLVGTVLVSVGVWIAQRPSGKPDNHDLPSRLTT
jgi:drug/metabolite transporter (DMT)-like permease